jgi:ABC-type taurine transport system ATPase subunit
MNAVECLNVSFNRGSRMVLDDISLSVAQGEFVALPLVLTTFDTSTRKQKWRTTATFA